MGALDGGTAVVVTTKAKLGIGTFELLCGEVLARGTIKYLSVLRVL